MQEFWDLVQLFKDGNSANEGATAVRIYDEVLNSLRKEGIPLENLIGFASDGCNTMMGQQNSVSSRFKEDFPGVMIQKCICHSLALCASEDLQSPSAQVNLLQLFNFPLQKKALQYYYYCCCRCEDLARDTYNYFKSSCKRIA